MEHIRSDLMAEVQKASKLNQEQIALCHQMDQQREMVQQKEREKDELNEAIAALKKQLSAVEGNEKNHAALEHQACAITCHSARIAPNQSRWVIWDVQPLVKSSFWQTK